jgi:hypothetical protein
MLTQKIFSAYQYRNFIEGIAAGFKHGAGFAITDQPTLQDGGGFTKVRTLTECTLMLTKENPKTETDVYALSGVVMTGWVQHMPNREAENENNPAHLEIIVGDGETYFMINTTFNCFGLNEDGSISLVEMASWLAIKELVFDEVKRQRGEARKLSSKNSVVTAVDFGNKIH